MKEKQEIIIRQMEPRDFVTVAELENSGWTPLETPVKIQSSPERYIENLQQGVRYFLAVEAITDEIFGVIVLFDRHKDLKAGKHVLTFSPMVVKNARHQGLGKFMLEFVIDFAREEGYQKISIDVLATNSIAIKLYESADFVLEGKQVKEFFIENVEVDNLIYAYFLN